MRIRASRQLREEMFKRVLIALTLFGVAIYILSSPDGVCFEIFFKELCNSEDKSVVLTWILVADSVLLAYVMSPFVKYGALKFLIKSK
ncbi:hypothetical protein D9981_09220, partial [Pseudoalteromonas phenolica O-BC30]